MKNNIKFCLYFISYYLGIIRLFYYINRNKQRILVFHHIIPDNMMNKSFEQKIVCTSLKHFDWLLSIVNKRFNVTTEINKKGTAIITFDDGYRAALTADKILTKYNNKAYFFVPLNIVGNGPLWIDKIMLWFAYVPEGKYQIKDMSITISANNRIYLFSKIIDSLYTNYDYNSIIDSLNLAFSFKDLNIDSNYYDIRFKGLSHEEIQSLKIKGHKIGAHSTNHDILTKLSDEQLTHDFNLCKSEIDNLFNTKLYAYPYGHIRDYNLKVKETCQKSDFTSAVINEINKEIDSFALSRINISHYSNKYEVEAALSGFTQFLKNQILWIK